MFNINKKSVRMVCNNLPPTKKIKVLHPPSCTSDAVKIRVTVITIPLQGNR